jgi:hypothetical protein
MDGRNKQLILLLLVIVLVTIGCITSTQVPPTLDSNAAYTAVAQTLFVRYTQSAGETAVAQLTQIALKPTDTPVPPTTTAIASATPTLIVPTSLQPTVTSMPRYCDWAEFIGDVSVVDNTVFPSGGNFTKTWRFRNIGSCDWTQAYSLVYVGGDKMGGSSAVALPSVVRPGGVVDVSVDLTAPEDEGSYRGNWMLRNPSGGMFGIGPDAQSSVWVQIQVEQPPSPDKYSYDFAANYCLAEWRNESIRLNCPGTINDPDGFVALLEQPDLESRHEDELALWTRPSSASNGWIIGEYPVYKVKAGDRFIAEIGCQLDSPQCELVFYLDYRMSDGTVNNLDSWKEDYDNHSRLVVVDLSRLSGRSVNFILSVQNKGKTSDANAIWFVPHIQNLFPMSELVITWDEVGGLDDTCNELRVYLVGDEEGEAQAVSCKDGVDEIGWVDLTDEEQDQVQKWVRELAPFDAETYRTSQGEPIITYLNFDGSGDEDASSSDIKTIQKLAERLFAKISE